ncbi:MAG: selenide, water dikinase SelD [Acidobacteriota bacterium]|nr:selenide, water dikinase SelD [Acidobacteriota bacterium]
MTNVIVGYETADDAGVYRLNENTALVQTVDFFTPIADEPEIYGQIAAINSLNDVYAMGGVPISALSIVCYPQKGDWNVLGEILLGGQKAMNAENVIILGGHSVDDQEIKFGYSVTGIVEPNRVVKNSGAKEGDVLILTKAIGTGVISTGIKFQKASEKAKEAALKTMTISAREASKVMQELGANGCTDVTGFGLLGHAYEMAKASKVTFKLESKDVPLLPEVLYLIEQKMLTRGDKNNRDYVGNTVKFKEDISKEMQSALFDPQTAGGLLISLEEEKAESFINQVAGSYIIGRVEEYKDYLIEVN